MNKKAYVITATSLIVGAYFVATQPITPEMAIVSSISVLLFAAPTYYIITKLLANKRGAILLAIMGAYALAIESSAIHTGFPYGNFVYTDVLGKKVLGLTPWTVAFAYPPIVFIAYWFARQLTKKVYGIIGIATFTAVAIDLVLDPAAVRLGFWYWDGGGFFYNVPLVNFLGWILTSFISALIIHSFFKNTQGSSLHGLAYSGICVVWFWTWVNIFLTQLWPSLIGIVLLAVFIRHLRRSTGILKA